MSDALVVDKLSFTLKETVSLEKAKKSFSYRMTHFEKTGMSKIQVENRVLENVNLKLAAGETLCLGGPSGRGKSLFLRILAGLEKPQTGNLYYFGEHLPREKHTALEIAKRQVGFVLQNGALISNLTVRNNVALPLRYHKRGNEAEIAERVNMALDLMRVRDEEDKFPFMLSIGMQKRVAIARSWVMDPRLLLMDEPTAGLDNYNRRNLLPLIDNMRRLFKTSIVIVTHDLMMAKELDCNISFLNERTFTEPHSFDYWIDSKEMFAQQLFRDLRNRGEM